MVKAVVGANWGDEGKGKITDMLADSADVVIRFQGGANAGRQCVEREFTILIYDRVPCVGAALKADHDVSGIRQHVRDLSFSLVAPVCAYDSFNHIFLLWPAE